MKAVIQRVTSASVSVEGEVVGSCGNGYMILLGAEKGDTEKEAQLLAQKTSNLRIFSDEEGKMNRSILDINGEVLAISQFTLLADVKKGNRPSFINALEPEKAKEYGAGFVAVKNANHYGIASYYSQMIAEADLIVH